MTGHATQAAGTHAPRIVVAWLVPSIPLAYGLFYTLKSALQLFTH